MMAPPGMRPTVGWFFWALASGVLLPCGTVNWKPPMESGPWATAYTTLSAPRSGVKISVPPWRLRASSITDTVTSILLPRRANGPSSAVTATTDTLKAR